MPYLFSLKEYENMDWGSFNSLYEDFGIEEKAMSLEDVAASMHIEDDLMVKPSLYVSVPDNNTLLKCMLKFNSNYSHQNHYVLESIYLMIADLTRAFYYMSVFEYDIFKHPYTDNSLLHEDQLFKKNYFLDVIGYLHEKEVNGNTPLEKACFILDFYLKETGDWETVPSFKNLGILLSETHGSKLYDHYFYDMEYLSLISDIKELSKDVGYIDYQQVLKNLSVIQGIGKEFEIKIGTTEVETPVSELVSTRVMRDFSQSPSIEIAQRLLPNFKYKFATKNLRVNVSVKKIHSKQKIIILVDYSGSMSTTQKQSALAALLIDRLAFAAKGECEIFFSYFVSRPSDLKFFHIYDKESAAKFISEFVSFYPSGGDTKIGLMVNCIRNEIEMGKLCNLDVDLRKEKVEILVINDGQDTVKTNKFTYKTNALTLIDGENRELKELCLQNKGKYLYLNSEGTLTAYNSEGKTVVN